ncbi:hypothetical protein VTN00DRAFT_9230 [Thermoascus crustaceus]|uniref:uncharacterized protein n=1 Tax=Thermoascus crustaceus TaxID=5088 RepID=UPI00374452CA
MPHNLYNIRRRVSVQDNLDPIVVGIDIGLTFTGVAFSTMDMESPNVIDHWPPHTKKVSKKVPTQLCYRAGHRGITHWGFSCPQGNLAPGMRVLDRFKLYLDENFLEDTFRNSPDNKVGAHEDVKTWYLDFLTEIYEYTASYICKILQLSHWESKTVKFTFSVPTTWDDSVIQLFGELVRKAGFGKHRRHSVVIDLSEAEAAAVYTIKSLNHHRIVSIWDDRESDHEVSIERPQLQKGDVILVCDSGGGTTDISILQVRSIESFNDRDDNTEEIAELRRLDSVDYYPSSSADKQNCRPRPCSVPQAVGSVQIDEAFRREALKRFSLIRKDEIQNISTLQVSEAMSKGAHFQSIKGHFGTRVVRDWKEFRVPVPGLPDEYNNADSQIRDGRMVFEMKYMRELFDTQVQRIFSAIDEQLRHFEKLNPSSHVSYFVLSGGLGSSKYVQDCILNRYGHPDSGRHILISDQPQLAVCKGLVIDQVHRLRYQESIVSTRCCRSSYGILFHEPVESRNSDLSWKIPLSINPIDGSKYAVDQIFWLIRRGEPVNRNKPVCQRFYRMVDIRKPETHWRDIIAVSKMRADHLPTNLHDGDVERIFQIVSELDRKLLTEGQNGVERKTKWVGWKAKEYWKMTLEVRVYIEMASLRFEIWCAGKRIGLLHPGNGIPQSYELGEEDWDNPTQVQGLILDD